MRPPARALFALVIAAALTACGGSKSAGTSAEAESPPPTTEAPPSNAAPSELQGTWLLASEYAAGPVRLYIRETTYTVSAGAAVTGDIAVEGNMIEFTARCGGTGPEGHGRYRWRLSGDTLHLDLVGKDECTGRSAVLEDATYRRLS
jgi:hypothetical protein